MKLKSLAFTLFFLVLSSMAIAAQTDCPQHYFGGQAPDILNEKLATKCQQLRYRGYGLIHSGISRTPLTSAEHLTRERVTRPQPERHNIFHTDPNIPVDNRAELADYAHSGYDRGHMAPSGDMTDLKSQYETFSLANIVPQNSDNNRGLWEGIESAARDLAKHRGDLYVVTGPIFYGSKLKRLNGRVLVPSHIFKAIYYPGWNKAAAYLVRNSEGKAYARISIAELDQLAGLRIFPQLPADIKVLDLPKPKMRQGKAVEDPNLMPRGKIWILILLPMKVILWKSAA
jgi:endonuclease G, mitochondrial